MVPKHVDDAARKAFRMGGQGDLRPPDLRVLVLRYRVVLHGAHGDLCRQGGQERDQSAAVAGRAQPCAPADGAVGAEARSDRAGEPRIQAPGARHPGRS